MARADAGRETARRNEQRLQHQRKGQQDGDRAATHGSHTRTHNAPRQTAIRSCPAEGTNMTIRGSCLCGGVTFEIDRARGPAEFCHCNRCRKRSGSASLLTIRVNTKDYRLLTGRDFVKAYTAPILRSPPPYQSFFCSNCGSPVP